MNQNNYAIIMAGGVGSRFWPVSTTEFPKQFHDMMGCGKTLIQKTFERLNHLIPTENILVLTNKNYKDLVLSQLPLLHENQVLLEPAMRNTAPCILYAALKIKNQNPDAVMVVAPSDHWIEDQTAFINNLSTCFEFASSSNALMTLGIQPTFPNTGFGYIEFDVNEIETVKKVNQFREKPNYETAKTFLAQGNFLWNAGIFIWSAATICKAFQDLQPEMYQLFTTGNSFYNTSEEQKFIDENYPKAANISIDYAILEKSENVYVITSSFDWNDLGTWGSLYEKIDKDKNNNAVIKAQTVLEDASNNIICTQNGKKVLINGLQDYIIVDQDNTLLIYPKAKEQEIKIAIAKF
ncbi:MAG: mannose-1-phosphate guanylyltransferase [Flavobacterium sp.]